MKRELKIFFTALMFYSRIPVPKSTGYSDGNLTKATRYFPLIGIIVGAIGAISFVGVNYILPIRISVLISLAIIILVTGAFHEDSISDFCDGFGGGYTKEKILSIMKDSSIGTYGAVGLIILILSKYILLTEIDVKNIPLVLIAAHGVSRINPVLLIFTSKYVRVDDSSKSKPIGDKNSIQTLLIAIILGIIPMFFISVYIIPFIIIALVMIFIYFRYYVHKKLGGYTGDVLGALQQFSEIGFYLSYIIVEQVI